LVCGEVAQSLQARSQAQHHDPQIARKSQQHLAHTSRSASARVCAMARVGAGGGVHSAIRAMRCKRTSLVVVNHNIFPNAFHCIQLLCVQVLNQENFSKSSFPYHFHYNEVL
jgi:hypothetical protein